MRIFLVALLFLGACPLFAQTQAALEKDFPLIPTERPSEVLQSNPQYLAENWSTSIKAAPRAAQQLMVVAVSPDAQQLQREAFAFTQNNPYHYSLTPDLYNISYYQQGCQSRFALPYQPNLGDAILGGVLNILSSDFSVNSGQ